MTRLLVTGAAGEIGQVILPYLESNYHLRGYDRFFAPGYHESVIGDICDFDTVSASMVDMDAVIHLAYPASGDFNSWDSVLHIGLDGTYQVFKAAVENRIRKIVYASTLKTDNYFDNKKDFFSAGHLPSPMDLYAGGKFMAESLARTFTTLNDGLDIICLRIGTIRNLPLITDHRTHHDHLSWCHPQDLAELIIQSIQTPKLGFQIFFGVSRNGTRMWDLETARRLIGYEPTHHADDYFVSDGLEELPFTRNQRTVLKAALLPDQPAGKQAWKRWSASLDRRLKIPGHEAVFELIPLASKAAVDDPTDKYIEEKMLLNRVAGVIKQSWYVSQLHLEAANSIAVKLQDRRIQFVFLDDLAAWRTLYRSEQTRKVHRIGLMVNPDQHSQTADLLVKMGWQAASDNPSYYASKFEHGPCCLILRNNLAPGFLLPWQNIMDHSQELETITFPDQNLMFLISCCRSVSGWKSESLLATVDAYRILHQTGSTPSPQVLLDLARTGNIRSSLFYGLHLLYRLTGEETASICITRYFLYI